MTIGIYSLYWEEQDLIYIGKSDNIEGRRWKEHLRMMRGNYHSNHKIQNAYNLYGIPTFSILEKCGIASLDRLEVVWTKEFNALDPTHGLCLVAAGANGGYGVHSSKSIYTKFQVLKTFSLLYRGIKTIPDIAIRTHIPSENIYNILNCNSHIWLKEDYPDKYDLMLKRNRKQRAYTSINRKTLSVISPDGIIYNNITCIADFCRQINLPNCTLQNVRNGFNKLINDSRYSTYKGWKLLSNK